MTQMVVALIAGEIGEQVLDGVIDIRIDAYAQVIRNGRGEVAALYPLMPIA